MKKIISGVLITSFISLGAPIFNESNYVDAATRKKCTQTNRGQVCKIEHYRPMTVRFSKTEARKIVNRYNKFTSNKSQLIQYVVGMHPVSGFALLAANIGYGSMINYFQTAVKKGTGVEFKFNYIFSQNSHSLNRVEKGRVSYK